jgi:prepilin-type N-terminal cleavage/methylation domain-containing protein
MMNRLKNSGFTLIEIAIVLIIVTILLGYTMAMVPIQQDLKQYRQADAEMDRIIESLYAFSQVNGYLPCPAWEDVGVTSDGFECRDIDLTAANCDAVTPDPTTDSCDIWFGYVPGKTLGVEGKYSDTGLLLDPWGQAYRYQVSDGDVGVASTNPDFVTPGEIQAESLAGIGLSVLGPDLEVCNTDDSAGAAGVEGSCDDAAETVVNNIPAVILSTGKDGADTSISWIQLENLDNDTSDRVFIKTSRRDVEDEEFDDLVKWISPNILYSKMIEAGQLP